MVPRTSCSCNASVVTAPGPAKLTPGGRYSPEFAVHVAEAKYLDHLPLERQARAMDRKGLDVDSQTLWDQLGALARHLTPTYHALAEKVLASEVVFMDETHWRLMEKDGSHRWWTWCVASEDAAAYWIRVIGSTGSVRVFAYSQPADMRKATPRTRGNWRRRRSRATAANPTDARQRSQTSAKVGRTPNKISFARAVDWQVSVPSVTQVAL